MNYLRMFALSLFAFAIAPVLGSEELGPIKVYILAGQSNMEGKAKVSLLDYQIEQPATRELFQHWRRDGKWLERDDVRIKFFDRAGPLTVGYGSPKCIGPELEFGTVVGNHFSEPVLLIKTAWGGRSLYRDFRSPSAGLPTDEVLQKILAQQQKKTPAATLAEIKISFGNSYRAMLAEVKQTLADLPAHFPADAKQGYEVAGFIWFQGWNDMINAEYTAEYSTNLQHFIRDVRKDLNVPQLPFVIGQMGVDGVNPSVGVQKFKAAQAKVLDSPEFKSNAALVKTDVYWDQDAAAVFKKGWKEHVAEWNKVGSDFPFHYLGSPKTMLGIGHAFGEAALQLRESANK
ncbi:hypothetical protein ETAA8_30330 [Anatilimnocola aggregata]|uniref:Sialate O-acetylesterase domain-containing protein n=1 Tax=Anatilimnocola aggregata TaxID=2528021 RepID=A0A517YCJ5_9BACT|nr:sialate O-acetylesterase [Anatilimnocola aggregata]QDU27941.1 hypothetical protein ETAA8_30330 [Anatilimnocola aggregata]